MVGWSVVCFTFLSMSMSVSGFLTFFVRVCFSTVGDMCNSKAKLPPSPKPLTKKKGELFIPTFQKQHNQNPSQGAEMFLVGSLFVAGFHIF